MPSTARSWRIHPHILTSRHLKYIIHKSCALCLHILCGYLFHILTKGIAVFTNEDKVISLVTTGSELMHNHMLRTDCTKYKSDVSIFSVFSWRLFFLGNSVYTSMLPLSVVKVTLERIECHTVTKPLWHEPGTICEWRLTVGVECQHTIWEIWDIQFVARFCFVLVTLSVYIGLYSQGFFTYCQMTARLLRY